MTWAEPWDEWLQDKLQYKLDGLVQDCVLEKTELTNVPIRVGGDGEKEELVVRKKFHFRTVLAGPAVNEDGEDSQGSAKAKKRAIELGRAAKVLRFALWDLETEESVPAKIVGVNVVGFLRGANPTPNRLKVLLNAASSLAYRNESHADRAEADALCGVALMNARRYRQAAEVFLRAADNASIAAKQLSGQEEEIERWGEHLLLLASHAFLEGGQQIPEATNALMRSASYGPKSREAMLFESGLVDAKTAMLCLRPRLVMRLIAAVEESDSPTVRLAGARLIEFMIEHLGCATGSSLGDVLNFVLSNYKFFEARESSTTIHRNLEQSFATIVDACCRLLQAMDHKILHQLLETTLLPIIASGDFSHVGADPEEEDISYTALSQQLRIVYITVNLLQGDVTIPPNLVFTLFSVSRTPVEGEKIPRMLRHTALICLNAVCKSLALSAKHREATSFSKYLYMMKELLEGMFEVTENDDFEQMDSAMTATVSSTVSSNSNPASFQITLGEGEKLRLNISDTKALNRLLQLIIDCVSALEPCRTTRSLSEAYCVIDLKRSILNKIADLSRSSMLDIALVEARINLAKTQGEYNPEDVPCLDLDVVLKTLEELWRALWLVIRLLPRNLRHQAEELQPMREIFEFIIERLKHRSPPQSLLRLLLVLVRGAGEVAESRTRADELLMLSLLRALTPWTAETVVLEVFDLVEATVGLCARFLMPSDLLSLLNAVSDQSIPEAQARAGAVLEKVASIFVMTTPDNPKEALQALDEFAKACGSQRMVVSLPQRNGTKQFNMESFYLHVLLSTCFQKYAGLSEQTPALTGYRLTAGLLDTFVDHAALTVACLSAAAKCGRKEHRDYVSDLLGDIFGTCVMMQTDVDSRVRLAALDIFCASMDVVFVVTQDEEDPSSLTAEGTRPTDVVGPLTCTREKATDMVKEEKAWNFLCKFVHSTLSASSVSEETPDHTVQRACLEFVKDCYLGALLGRRSGASVIGMENLGEVWDALERCHNSTWRVLSVLAAWIQCLLVNVAFYVAICGKGRASQRMRWSGLTNFFRKTAFPKIQKELLSSIHEQRLWGIRLVETYLRLRHANGVSNEAPPVPQTIWDSIDALKEDWYDDVAVTAGSLRIFTLGSENTMRLELRESAELWIPEMPTELLESEFNADNLVNKSLEVFLQEHQDDVDLDLTDNEAEQSDWVHVSDVSAIEESITDPMSTSPGAEETTRPAEVEVESDQSAVANGGSDVPDGEVATTIEPSLPSEGEEPELEVSMMPATAADHVDEEAEETSVETEVKADDEAAAALAEESIQAMKSKLADLDLKDPEMEDMELQSDAVAAGPDEEQATASTVTSPGANIMLPPGDRGSVDSEVSPLIRASADPAHAASRRRAVAGGSPEMDVLKPSASLGTSAKLQASSSVPGRASGWGRRNSVAAGGFGRTSSNPSSLPPLEVKSPKASADGPKSPSSSPPSRLKSSRSIQPLQRHMKSFSVVSPRSLEDIQATISLGAPTEDEIKSLASEEYPVEAGMLPTQRPHTYTSAITAKPAEAAGSSSLVKVAAAINAEDDVYRLDPIDDGDDIVMDDDTDELDDAFTIGLTTSKSVRPFDLALDAGNGVSSPRENALREEGFGGNDNNSSSPLLKRKGALAKVENVDDESGKVSPLPSLLKRREAVRRSASRKKGWTLR